jgi:hypothetical protein
MSATRRAASETNILAMLDRQASGALTQRLLRSARAMPAMFWYGTAGVLVCGMVATLAWLAHDSGTSAAVDTALAGSVTPGGARVVEVAAVLPGAADHASVTASVTAHVPANLPANVPASVSAPLHEAADAPVPEPAPKAGATIVNVAPAAAEPAAAAPTVAHTLPPPARALARQQHSGRITPREAQREPQRLAAQAAMARISTPRTAALGKPAPAAVRPAGLAHAGPAAAAHGRRQAAPVKAAAPSVDTDVALISAIIQHAATRQETEEAACADRACGPRMPAKP